MAILEEYVEVTVGCRVTAHYESRGYAIPRRADKQGRLSVPRGTRITVKVSDLPKRSNVRLTKICDRCGELTANQTYNLVIHTRRHGRDTCKKCSYEDMRETKLTSTRRDKSFGCKVPEMVRYWHPNNRLSPFDVPAGTNRKYEFICEVNSEHTYSSQVRHVANGHRCPLCSSSSGERAVRDALVQLGVAFTQQATTKGLVGVSGGPLMFDFVLHTDSGDWAAAIEYDGKQHFEPVDFLGKGMKYARKSFVIQKEHDRRKTDYCKLSEIPLLRIKYTQSERVSSLVHEFVSAIGRRDAAFYIA